MGENQAIHHWRKGTREGNARDTRQFINGVFWILRTGAPWRDLPETYGNWKKVHRRFCRWRDKGIWEKILEALVDNTDFEWLLLFGSLFIDDTIQDPPGGM